MNLAHQFRGPLGLKDDKPSAARIREGKNHMRRVAALPCVICHRRPVEVHHCISDRFSQRRASDFETIPLCTECHRAGPMAIHRSKSNWERHFGPDHQFLPVVADMLAGEWNP